MIKFIKMVPTILSFLIYYYPKIWYMKLTKKPIQDFSKIYHRFIEKVCRISFNVVYQNYNLENVPEGQCIFMPNHIHYFDPIALLGFFDKNIFFVGKKEIRKYFLVGNIMNNIGSFFLDRSSLREGVKMIKTVTNLLNEQKDENLCIFPEGTRTKDLENFTMGEFHPGTFKIAYNTKLPIVPTILFGTNDVLNTKVSKKKYVVIMKFLKPLYYEEYKDLTTEQLANTVRDRMVNELENVKHDFILKDLYFNSKDFRKGH